MINQFRMIGKDLFTSGLVTSHGGNMSARIGDSLVITVHGSMLGNLRRTDLVKTTIRGPHPADRQASFELPVHRAIYEQSDAMAVIHSHPAHAVALSLLCDNITPPDLEASYLLGTIPVIKANLIVVSQETVELVPSALKEAKAVMIRGHGCFAIGQSLEEAFHWTSVLEHSCRIAFLLQNFQRPGRDL
ncbi:MAG: aldolase [Dehalococcoidia bacterium]|nr:aldolase [Dehalococcoidia bacterium]